MVINWFHGVILMVNFIPYDLFNLINRTKDIVVRVYIVLIFYVEFRELSHLTLDPSQAEKKIHFVKM
jgi:hypothetical protein